MTANTAGLNKGFKKARGMTSSFAGGIAKLGAGVAAIGAPVGLIAGMAKVVSVGSEFQKEISNVKAFVTGTAEQHQQLSDTAESLGESTAFTASQAAQAMTEMAKAGLSANQILRASEGVLTLAAAGDIEMAEAAKIAAAALNQFGVPASEMGSVVDQLAKAASSGSISLSGMGTQLAYASASAKKARMGLGETAAVIASLATTMTAEKAGTGFRAMMNSITAPTAEAAAEMRRLKIETMDANDKFLPFPDIIANFNNALSGLSDGARAKSMGKMFTTIGDPAIAAMLELNADGIRDVTAAVADSDGFGLSVAEEKLDNVSGSFKELTSKVEAFSINLFQMFQEPLQQSLDDLAGFIGQANEMLSTDLGNIAAAESLADSVFGMFIINAEEVLTWLFDNWKNLFADLVNVAVAAFQNISTNAVELFSAMWESLRSGENVPFHFTPLLDGFERTSSKLRLTTADELKSELQGMGNAAEDSSRKAKEEVALSVADLGDLGDNTRIKSSESSATDSTKGPLAIALRGSREAFDVINKAIKGGSDNHMKSIAKQAEKQTAIQQQQVGLLEDIAEGDSDVEVLTF